MADSVTNRHTQAHTGEIHEAIAGPVKMHAHMALFPTCSLAAGNYPINMYVRTNDGSNYIQSNSCQLK